MAPQPYNIIPRALSEPQSTLGQGGCVPTQQHNSPVLPLQVLEEVGYDVKVEDMRPVTVYVSSTGISGSKHHMFYAAVSESMRSNGGGGVQ